DVEERRTAKHLLAFRLGDATGHGDDHIIPRAGPPLLQHAQPPELRIDLFRGLLPDMAGIQDHHIGRVGGIDGLVAERRQDIRHTGGVIEVHLAAVGSNKELFGQCGTAAARTPSVAGEDAANLMSSGSLSSTTDGRPDRAAATPAAIRARQAAAIRRRPPQVARVSGGWNSTTTVTVPRPT